MRCIKCSFCRGCLSCSCHILWTTMCHDSLNSQCQVQWKYCHKLSLHLTCYCYTCKDHIKTMVLKRFLKKVLQKTGSSEMSNCQQLGESRKFRWDIPWDAAKVSEVGTWTFRKSSLGIPEKRFVHAQHVIKYYSIYIYISWSNNISLDPSRILQYMCFLAYPFTVSYFLRPLFYMFAYYFIHVSSLISDSNSIYQWIRFNISMNSFMLQLCVSSISWCLLVAKSAPPNSRQVSDGSVGRFAVCSKLNNELFPEKFKENALSTEKNNICSEAMFWQGVRRYMWMFPQQLHS